MKIILFLPLLLLLQCVNSTPREAKENTATNMNSAIEKVLKKKYSEDFTVTDAKFDKALNIYTFSAHPKSNKKIVFEGNFDEREENDQEKIDHDAYPNMKFSFEAAEYFESLFPNKQLKHVTDASVNSKYTHSFGSEVPSLDEYLENRKEGSSIRMNSYFFEVPDRAFSQSVVTLRAVLETLHEKFENNYSLFAGFWPKGFLEGKNLEDLTFGFESTSDQDADNLLNVMQYLSKVLFIKIVNGSVDEIDEQKMFDLIKADNKNGPNEMVEI